MDIFNTLNMPTCMGSSIWQGFTPGNDARVVAALRGEGGVILGKTVTAEFAVHHPGPTVNPFDPGYSPGTSSSGSAVAVAARMVPLALGTQTAGSTIRPASYCGVYGFKPSFGVIPRTGILKTLDTLDHVSFFARSLDDLGLLFDCTRVRGTNHPYVHQWIDSWSPEKIRSPFRIALVRGPAWEHAEPYAQDALLALAAEWAKDPEIEVEEVELPEPFKDAHDLHETIYSKALSYYFKRECEEHSDQVSETFRSIVERGRMVSSEAYWAGLKLQQALKRSLDRFFDNYEIILNLSTSGVAPKGLHGREKKDSCLIWTLCHAPAINVPLFQGPSGLPYGAQIVAGRYQDLGLLWLCKAFKDKGLIREWVGLNAPADVSAPQTNAVVN